MKKIIVLTGPTAVGKTSLSIKLAKAIGGEIISADSMQVYKKMDIGSAKINKSQMDGINHYLIDVLDPDKDFNVYIFKKMATDALNQIYLNGNIPIIVGGTGFYIQALLYDIDFSEEDNTEIRQRLEAEASLVNGKKQLYERLKSIDPQYAETVHENNVKKVIRALEYYDIHGELFSAHNENEKLKKSPYDFKYFVLTDDRDILYENINKRVDAMVEEGLVSEVKELKSMGLNKDNNSMQGLGYKEIIDYLDGKCLLDEAIDKIKLETRHFAKRQLTWFRREKDVIFINKPDFDRNDDRILEYIIGEISNEK